MTWLRLDDTMDEDEGVIELSDRAFRLYVRALLYCARKDTDGIVRPSKADELDARGRGWQEIIDNDLCEVVEGGYYFDRFLEYNPSRDEVKARREADRKRKADWRSRKKGGHGVTDAGQDAGRTAEETRDSALPDPTRPAPTRFGFENTLQSPAFEGGSGGDHPSFGEYEVSPDQSALLASMPDGVGDSLLPWVGHANKTSVKIGTEALRVIRGAYDTGTAIASPVGFYRHHVQAMTNEALENAKGRIEPFEEAK